MVMADETKRKDYYTDIALLCIYSLFSMKKERNRGGTKPIYYINEQRVSLSILDSVPRRRTYLDEIVLLLLKMSCLLCA